MKFPGSVYKTKDSQAQDYVNCVTLCHLYYCLQITKTKVWVKQKPWKRVEVGGKPHNHGTSYPAAIFRSRNLFQAIILLEGVSGIWLGTSDAM